MKEVDAKGAVISLGDDIEGILKASEISRDRVEDARNVLKEGEEVEAKIISIDRKSRVISLSVKSKDVDDEKDAMKELRKQEVESAGPTTIGDLIRAQMENQAKSLIHHEKGRPRRPFSFSLLGPVQRLISMLKET